MEEKEKLALLLCQAKGDHSRLVPQELCPPSLVSRKRLYSQAGVYDKDQVSSSLVKEWVREVAQSCLTLCDPMDCSLPVSSVHGIPRREYWSGLPFPSLGDLPHPGIKHGSPTLQADSLPSKPPGKNSLVIVSVAQSCPTLYDLMDWTVSCQASNSLVFFCKVSKGWGCWQVRVCAGS